MTLRRILDASPRVDGRYTTDYWTDLPTPSDVARLLRELPGNTRDGSTLREILPLGRLVRGNSADTLRIIHEITHFTSPVPDRADRYGRPQYLTFHQFISAETLTRLPTLLAESVQYSGQRDRAPPPDTDALRAYRASVRRRGAQMFRRYHVCEDPEFDVDLRTELPASEMRD